MRGVRCSLLASCVVLAVAGSWIVWAAFSGDQELAPPEYLPQEIAKPIIKVAGADWVADLQQPTRVVGVATEQIATAKESLKSGAIDSPAFEFETLGPLSAQDVTKYLQKLNASADSVLSDLLRMQSLLEGSPSAGLVEYRKFLEVLLSYEGYKAALQELSAGQHFTLPTAWAMKTIPMPANYTYVGGSFMTDAGKRVLVVVPYSYNKWTAVRSIRDNLQEIRGHELEEQAATFNAMPEQERARLISEHVAARKAIIEDGNSIDPERREILLKKLISGPFLIDRDNSVLRVPRR